MWNNVKQKWKEKTKDYKEKNNFKVEKLKEEQK